MQIKLIITGSAKERYLQEGMSIYEKRLSHYIPFTIIIAGSSKSRFPEAAIKEEAKNILKNIKPADYVVLLDQNGKNMSSENFAAQMQSFLNKLNNNLIFIIGGAYGFDDSIYKRADFKLALSHMTFPHEMIRLFFLEQLYRAFTILRNESYHH